MMIGHENPLTTVDGVMNAVMVKGNAVGTTMYYGSGAGSLPTASAVCGDVIECVKNNGRPLSSDYSSGPISLLPVDEVERPFFVRYRGTETEAIRKYGEISHITVLKKYPEEFGFLTPVMAEKTFKAIAAEDDKVIKWIRRGKKEEAE